MDTSYRLILLLMLYCFSNLVSAQDYEDPERLDRRISRLRKNPRKEKSIKKPDYVKDRDLSYPGCGFRSLKIQGTSAKIFNTRGKGRELFSDEGKRSTSGSFPIIIGGDVTEENSWPWMVAIHPKKDGKISKTVRCGASLVSQKYILTAAHCFKSNEGKDMNTDPSKFSVVVGAHTVKDGTAYPVRQILIHPSYKLPVKYHDIALIEVERPVELSEKVYPVCLPSDGLREKIEKNKLNVTVTGWGRTSSGGRSSKILQEVTIPIVPLNECNASYSCEIQLPQGITKQQICAGVQGKGSCQGDSGGPLVLKLKDNSHVQLGIVSFGYKCTQLGNPTVYTRVSEYTKWIYDNTDLGK